MYLDDGVYFDDEVHFDEFLVQSGFPVRPVERLDGFTVEVGLPPDWEPFDSIPGLQAWVCTDDPRATEFCSNAVLTMHRIGAALDPAAAFAMLSDQQVQTVPASRELHREFVSATEGPGDTGTLVMQIPQQFGIVDSVSRCRIVVAEHGTLIAQLTVTALHDSPADRSRISLAVRPA